MRMSRLCLTRAVCLAAVTVCVTSAGCRNTAARPEPLPTSAALQEDEPAPALGTPCDPAAGIRCVKATATGNPSERGTSRAQCSGTFPDYVVPATAFPEGYTGPWFQLSQDFPATPPPPDGLPWTEIDFRQGAEEADDYLYALRDYAFEGMTDVDFVPAKNTVRRWFHMPLMNFGPGRRDLTHGVTKERPIRGPELGVKPGVTIDNYAVGFYNEIGAAAIGAVWGAANAPDLTKLPFPEGTMVFKILFSDATASDFSSPPGDLLAGAPSWQIATGGGKLTTIRLLQMDVAARDARAGTTGWVFGTFAFDASATDADPWRRLRPVGLAWGNDPGYTPADQQAGKALEEAFVSPEVPAFAKAHLGWAGRVNGPVDNPVSACVSCHSTAQYPVDAALAPFAANCNTDVEKLRWFRNLAGTEPFGKIDSATCLPVESPPAAPLDFSLQMQVAVQSALQFKNVNPCAPPAAPEAAFEATTPALRRSSGAPRVSRGGFVGEAEEEEPEEDR